MNAPLARPYGASDEIDLLALFKALWGQKFLILAITALTSAMAVGYALTATPQYQVQSVLRPASLKDLDELNESMLYSLAPDAALRMVGDALDSYSLRLKFFEQHPELLVSIKRGDESLDQLLDRLNRSGFAMLRPDPKKGTDTSPFQGISLTYAAGVDGVALVNGLVAAAIDQERVRIQEDFEVLLGNRLARLQSEIAAERARYEADKEARIAGLLEADSLKKSTLQDELTSLRQQVQARRQNRIKQLDEAIRIAEELGISKPTTPSALGESTREVQGSVIRTEVNNQQIPLYFMGVDTLKAERAALIARRSDDFTEPRIVEIQAQLSTLANNREVEILKRRENEDLFFKNLVKLRGEKARLEGLRVDFSRLQLVHVDQVATTPQQPIKPRKVLIVAIGLVAGLILGTFVALIRSLALRSTAPIEVRSEVVV
ncbi:Wzz/FepE/Etk N-terminal domain-containing protein [Pseudomonas sp. LFM046]|uniref:Wzz/FepE/Etk N-terminal domain-containing protein n=1 Tax=Pseudomonas sp. LFM046 TaxID=1608357 RepID=UPI0005CFCBA5|nr:Wzz/FepE/Etk N-terminal domain-containing protein [Pseudomonas sp. LFM046]